MAPVTLHSSDQKPIKKTYTESDLERIVISHPNIFLNDSAEFDNKNEDSITRPGTVRLDTADETIVNRIEYTRQALGEAVIDTGEGCYHELVFQPDDSYWAEIRLDEDSVIIASNKGGFFSSPEISLDEAPSRFIEDCIKVYTAWKKTEERLEIMKRSEEKSKNL
ncbi:hypothetical protein HOD83_02085 [Candidatus Woesearchaeota archaeon]|jgi:hypothetical protein|nr:hypothetical protein [Candidatus Woesearchaeota archaeon]MBT4114661.1 hypothetical protein [Candidatus Woesearchaeota archaeon]MBT4248355.1 hypothetical protein [Candidatus Woesearchaeota archaeon]